MTSPNGASSPAPRVSKPGDFLLAFFIRPIERPEGGEHLLHGPQAWTYRAASILGSARGATAVEYGLMVALIAVAIVGAVTFLGQQISATFQDILDNVP